MNLDVVRLHRRIGQEGIFRASEKRTSLDEIADLIDWVPIERQLAVIREMCLPTALIGTQSFEKRAGPWRHPACRHHQCLGPEPERSRSAACRMEKPDQPDQLPDREDLRDLKTLLRLSTDARARPRQNPSSSPASPPSAITSNEPETSRFQPEKRHIQSHRLKIGSREEKYTPL